MILFGKLTRQLFLSENKQFAVFELRLHGGEYHRAVFSSKNPHRLAPPARKTVGLMLSGTWQHSDSYGAQFWINDYQRAENCTKKRESDADALLGAMRHVKMEASL